MSHFDYLNANEAAAILGAVSDLGLDFTDEPSEDDDCIMGTIWVDDELESEYDEIQGALLESREARNERNT